MKGLAGMIPKIWNFKSDSA